jgi:SpoVK/Ycf46/Vps4 family AAA+-type ATPase
MILQFDEADSLFSKRGEVREARDRYANMEVSHLLARIEAHTGPCILTTNLRDQMDPAFARRFHVVIDFPRPDRAARRLLWQRLLPPRAPLGPCVDLDLVAEAADISGGGIRNAATHAAVLAASDGGKALEISHIARAVWSELGKEGRPVAAGEIGLLAAHLDRRRS